MKLYLRAVIESVLTNSYAKYNMAKFLLNLLKNFPVIRVSI